jgi:hypothetical protein
VTGTAEGVSRCRGRVSSPLLPTLYPLLSGGFLDGTGKRQRTPLISLTCGAGMPGGQACQVAVQRGLSGGSSFVGGSVPYGTVRWAMSGAMGSLPGCVRCWPCWPCSARIDRRRARLARTRRTTIAPALSTPRLQCAARASQPHGTTCFWCSPLFCNLSLNKAQGR